MDEDTRYRETHGLKDLILTAGLAVLAIFAALTALVVPAELTATVPLIAIRTVFVLPLVFLLPGYALLQAIWPIRPLEWAERALMSIGLSLTVAILGGLALNFTSWGLQTVTWTVLLAGFTLLCCGIAVVRRAFDHNHLIPILDASSLLAASMHVSRRLSFLQGVMIALSCLLVAAAVTVSVVSASQSAAQGYTQLWLVPPAQGTAITSLQVGVRSMETNELTYTIEISLQGSVVQTLPAFSLAPQRQWQMTVPVPSVMGSSDQLFEVLLYRVDQPATPYRHVSIWLTPAGTQTTPAVTQTATP